MNKKNVFVENVLYAFASQIVSLLLSVLMSLIVPKLLGVENYSYWQLFIFYVGYVGFSHFGLTDGVYLKLGGQKYENLDYSLYKSQLILSLLIQLLIAIVIISAAVCSRLEYDRVIVITCAMVYMLVFNATGYLGYIFQAVNETRKYSISIMLDRALFIVAVLAAFVLKSDNYLYFIIFYTVSKGGALVYCCWEARQLIRAKTILTVDTAKIMLSNISVGAKLLLANIASTLILGIGRMVIDASWGITTFGKISFSLSLTSFFLQFISQISMVLFPTLRQVNEESQVKLYEIIRDVIGTVLPLTFVAYYPMKLILGRWLPNYRDSLVYLAYLLPICTYDGKMQLLCNTYFKVKRKENWLLIVNFIASGVNVVLCWTGAHVLNNITAVVIGMVIAIAFRSIISEIYLGRLMKQNVLSKIMMETVLVLVFVCSVRFMTEGYAFLFYLVVYSLYLISHRKLIASIAKKCFQR